VNSENPNFFASRHAERSFGSSPDHEFPGLTEKGVESAREQTSIIMDIIKDAPERGVIALCGTSEALRTKSTAKVYTETVEREITR
jgi:phosphohistidine phosphatase SixA